MIGPRPFVATDGYPAIGSEVMDTTPTRAALVWNLTLPRVPEKARENMSESMIHPNSSRRKACLQAGGAAEYDVTPSLDPGLRE